MIQNNKQRLTIARLRVMFAYFDFCKIIFGDRFGSVVLDVRIFF